MDDRNNTIAGWVLGAGIVALGAGIVSSELFKAERPEKMGYPIAGVVETGGGAAAAEEPIEARLAAADPAAGEKTFAKCAACHSINKGGANGVGPNLWGTVGSNHAHVAGFAYSDALKGKSGPWDWASLDAWLKSPRKYAEGTKMTFAGLSDAQDRANLIAYLNTQSDAPKPLPAAPAEAAPDAASEEAAAEAPAELNAAEAPAAGE
ncbi:c-type cytochrome [Sphingomonas changnyeongensis]|uniref:C-type cytochrome n=1 Tax=Sphingomonas changnyeongensis TaxID=2698679 RepID=A0A7Z2S725_9SPHN|nr:cytochrome c family protein [Sphingomonas changnyeongensis]QHL89941.1 c-type cytochrome [Sphingomonas changnyeongensis]